MAVYQKRDKWFIDDYYQGRRVRECVSTSKKEAKRGLATRKGEILQGGGTTRSTKSARGRLRYWLASTRSIPRLTSVPGKETSFFRNTPAVFFGGRLLTQINPFLVEEYKRVRLEAGVKPATVNREVSCLKHMFNLAVRWSKLNEDLLRNIKLLWEDNRMESILAQEEVGRL
jgi:hypothetical protein